MTPHTATLVGIALNLIGTVFLVLDSIRISKRVLRNGITLADDAAQRPWGFRYASAFGFGLLFVSFGFQAYAVLKP